MFRLKAGGRFKRALLMAAMDRPPAQPAGNASTPYVLRSRSSRLSSISKVAFLDWSRCSYMASAAAFQSFTQALTMARCSLRVSSSRCTPLAGDDSDALVLVVDNFKILLDVVIGHRVV